MKELLSLYIFMFFFVPVFTQIEDDFSDGNITEHPTWEGNLNDFIINSDHQLQLNAINSGQSFLYLKTFIEAEMEWNFLFKMDFNPSTSNSLRIYLQADEVDLLNSSGYFLEIGESDNNDAIKFYRQDNGTKHLLATATLGAVAEQPEVRIQVIRDNEGDWQLFADYSGGNNLAFEASVKDATYIQNGQYYFGWYCKYTATRLDGFFFDDFSLNALSIDGTPPVLMAIKIEDAQRINLVFNEPLLENTATNETNYIINKGIGNPTTANLIAQNEVLLIYENELINNEHYTLSINNLSDLKGNTLNPFDTTFLFTKIETAEQYDILINEIMEDATLESGGTLGLPAEEYVELYNRSNKTINLEGFTFSDGGTRAAEFPFYLMQPNTYLIIGKTTASEFVDIGNFLGLSNFPTLSSEETLVLKNELGISIDIVSYTQDWYGNSSTARGGYSLERINPTNPCLGITNWQGANSFLGGTPGSENSVLGATSAILPLNLIDAYPINATQIKLTFNKAIKEEDLLATNNYSITNNEITSLSLVENDFRLVLINLQNPLIEHQIETITVATNFSDCIGNLIDGQASYPIALPTIPSTNDLVINEILFNPQTGGVDFVELFNRSQEVIDLKGLILANQALDNPQIKPIEIEKLLFPNDYVVLTESPSDIQSRYTVKNNTAIFTQDLPTFEDKNGNINLYTNEGLTTIFIDEFDYIADFHNPLLNDKNGVSLERINPDLPTQDAGNWHSASSEVGFATPTYQNSQQIQIVDASNNIFTLSGNRISPDGDGFEDVLQINYATERNGYSATIHIYDAAGRLIDKIAQNELLATMGSFKWEGTTLDNQQATLGIYVLWIEYVNLGGEVGVVKEAVVVAERF